jgi:hypothetical protein
MTNDIADFVRRKADIYGDAKIVKPEFGFLVATADVKYAPVHRARSSKRTRDRDPSAEQSAFVPAITE